MTSIFHPSEPTLPDTVQNDLPLESVCLFQCGSIALGIRLESVAELLEVDRLVPLPLCPPEILGLCALRREVIPVVAVAGPDRSPTPRSDSSILALILRSPRGPWALKIDSAGTVVTEDRIESHAPREWPESSLVLHGSLKRESLNYEIIDAETTWHRLRERIESGYFTERGRETPVGVKNGRLLDALEV